MPSNSEFKCVVVGSGLFGLTIAERVANILKIPVLVIEKRDHIGGNAWGEKDSKTGIEIHKYGSHIFHTSNEKIWEYINNFTEFTSYTHKVLAKYDDELYSTPINLKTINKFFKKALTSEEAEIFLEKQRHSFEGIPTNLEEKAIQSVGPELYEAFIKGYTIKQWQKDPKELPTSIISRLPVRYTSDDRYFEDIHQGMPANGYAEMIENISTNPLIKIECGVDFIQFKKQKNIPNLTIYTGALDRYFNYQHGLLDWRTLDFEIERLYTPDFQGTSVINYPSANVSFTRIHEFKHFYPGKFDNLNETLIMREYSRTAGKEDEPFYPVNSEQDRAKLQKYRQLIQNEKNVYFGGRLGSYQYLDMHMAIGSALSLFENQLKPMLV
jgi:UDP-galactopyranose mutase